MVLSLVLPWLSPLFFVHGIIHAPGTCAPSPERFCRRLRAAGDRITNRWLRATRYDREMAEGRNTAAGRHW
jgi:hypothetical protein